MYDGEVVYANSRDSENASNDSNGSLTVGQETGYKVHRGFIEVPIPALESVESCYLYVYGKTDASTTDFNIMLYEGDWVLGLARADINNFDGWRAANTHNGTSLTDGWNTSNMTEDNWHIIEFNAAGRAAVLAAAETTMEICMVSSKDVSNTAPEGNEYVAFDAISASGTEPFLSINGYNMRATNDGRIRSYDNTYTTARDDGAEEQVLSTQFTIGQSKAGEPFYLWRAFASFVLPEMSVVTSVILFLDGITNSSGTDFEIYIFTSTYTDPLETGDWGLFDGHQASGAYDGTILNDVWDSDDYSATWNQITFNEAGRTAVLAAQNTTFKVALISKEDYGNSTPGDDEYIIFSPSFIAGETEPFLEIVYTYSEGGGYTGTACGVDNPANVCGVAKANLKNFCGVE